MALLTEACGGSPSSSGSGDSASAGSSSAVAYSACMRAHGVPNHPDPDSSGNLQKTSAQQLGVSSSAFNAAQRACQDKLPSNTGGSFADRVRQCYLAGDCPPARVQQMMTVGRKAARCMRAHGVRNWPDPSLGPQGHPSFNISGAGITSGEWHSGSMRTEVETCSRQAGGWLATG